MTDAQQYNAGPPQLTDRLPNDSVSRTDHNEAIQLERRLSTLETKVTIILYVLGPVAVAVIVGLVRIFGGG